MSNIFQTGNVRAASPALSTLSVQGEETPASNLTQLGIPGSVSTAVPAAMQQEASRAGGSSADTGVKHAGKQSVRFAGSGPARVDPRKYKYDLVRGSSVNLGFGVTRDDRMSASEAGAKLHDIHVMFGVETGNHEFLTAFDKALWFCHTLNSGSTLIPGRSSFAVAGFPDVFGYEQVRNKLNVDMRRFFRAFADDITAVNKQVISEFTPYDPVKEEHYGWLMQVASERGLHRFPHLAHDSAEACIRLNQTERAALAASKMLVISTTNNSADRMRAGNKSSSADNYDSTTGTVL